MHSIPLYHLHYFIRILYTYDRGTDFDIGKESGAKYFQKALSVSIHIREKYVSLIYILGKKNARIQ